MRSGRFLFALFAVQAVFFVVVGFCSYQFWLDGNAGRRVDAPVQWVDLRVAIGTVFSASILFLTAAIFVFALAMNHSQDVRAQVKRLEAEVGRLHEAADRQTRNARRLEDELDRLRGSLAYPQELP
jgi:hypothetical protein